METLYSADRDIDDEFGMGQLVEMIKDSVEEIDPKYKYPGKFRVHVTITERVYNELKGFLKAALERFPERQDEIGNDKIYWHAWNANIYMNYLESGVSIRVIGD